MLGQMSRRLTSRAPRLDSVFCLVLAAACLVAALLLPVQQIDARKADRVAQIDREAADQASRLAAGDDTYIEWGTHPYPISSGGLLRIFLFADAVLLAAAAVRGSPPSSAEAMAPPWPSGEGRTALALTVVGGILRFTGVGRDMWIDEITTLMRHVRSSFADILMQATSSNNHLLNSLLGRASVLVFGESAWALRLPAVVFGIATIPVFFALVRRFASYRETVLATLALVLSYHHLFFSQDARGYAGFLFGGLLGTLALVDALDTNSRRAWFLYVAAMVVSVTSVMIGVVLLVSQLVVVTLLRPTRRFYTMLALTGFLIGHSYALVIPDVLGFVFNDYRRPEVGWHLSSEFAQVVFRGLGLGPATAAVLVAGAALGLVGVASYWRQHRLFTSLLIVPELAMITGLVAFHVAVFPRFFLFALPVAFVMFARGVMVALDRLPGAASRRVGYIAALAAVAAGSVVILRTWWLYPKQNYTAARRFVEAQLREGDAVVTVGIAGEAYRYYWPEIAIVNRVSQLDEIITHHRRVWVLYSFPRDMEQRRPRLLRQIRDRFREEQVFRGMVGDGELRVGVTGAGQGLESTTGAPVLVDSRTAAAISTARSPAHPSASGTDSPRSRRTKSASSSRSVT